MQKTTHIMQAGRVIRRQPPVNLVPADTVLFEKALTANLPEITRFDYKNACVTPEGIVFKGLALDSDLLIYPKHKKIYNILYLLSSLVKRKKIRLPQNETYLLIFDYWSNSIFHWMCDALPRLEAIKAQAENYVLLLPENYAYDYIHASLKPYRLKGIYTLPLNAYACCPRLISVGQVTVSGEINPANFTALRKTILDFYQPLFKGEFTRRNIYISRAKAKYRKVLNEEELLPLLRQYNFEIIFFEDMTFAQQVECCFHATNIISIHGANLTNTIFMRPGGNVMEFRKINDRDNNYFYSLADSVGCGYYYQNCETVDHVPGQNFFDLLVDKTKFEMNLHLMLGTK